MPHTRNAKKRLRQNAKRRVLNRASIKAIKTQAKKVQEILDSGGVDQARAEFNVLAKRLDKAAARRVVHPNLAARKKSQYARLLQNKSNAPAPT